MPKALFSDVIQVLRDEIWPEGEASNLVASHTTFFKEAFIEIQKFTPQLKQHNITAVPFCSTFFEPCGKTVLEMPRGIVRRVYTINSDWCDKVHYREWDFADLDAWAYQNLAVVPPDNKGFPELPTGFKYADKITDSAIGRARYGIWAKRHQRIYIAPWIQSNEQVIIEWDGVKRQWDNTDVLDLDLWTDEVMNVVKLCVLVKHETFYGDDAGRLGMLMEQKADAFGENMWSFGEEDRKREDMMPVSQRFPTKTELDDDKVIEQTDTVTFCQIGDTGTDDSNEQAVADLVASFGPNLIIHAGDVSYDDKAYDVVVGKYYRDFIYPYSGAYGTSAATTNKFWPVPGNHDWDFNGLADYLAFFALKNNERYYDFAVGPCHFFGLSSDPREPGGNTITSEQHEWLQAKLFLSQATWKIGFNHHAPFSSSADHGDTPDAQWDYGDLGLDILFSGHNHQMEHIVRDGFNYVVNGAGGKTLYDFATPVEGSEFRYNAKRGAVKVTATCSKLTVEFWSVDKEKLYDFSISK